MFRVTKRIEFCYGHRLLHYEGKCRHLHGQAIKNWIDDTLDHRMLLNKDDPLVPILKQRGELFYVMDENPTAENIAKLIFDHARSKGLPVVEVQLWETPTSSASYRG